MVRIRVVVGLVVEIMECDGVVIAGKKKMASEPLVGSGWTLEK